MNGLSTLAWSIWQRNNRWLTIIAIYIVLYATVIARFVRAENENGVIFVLGSLVLVFCYLALIGIFMYQDTDVGVRGSAYPPHMLTLPVRTYKLVLMPMIMGTLAFLASGLIISQAIHAGYQQFPLYWPTMLITAMLAMLQALFWYPLGIPYSKLILTLVGIPMMIYQVSVSLESKVSETVVCQWLAVFTLLCYVTAYHGVVRARRGELQMFTLNLPTLSSPVKKNFKWLSFKDKFDAQRWYEWRQQGLILPCLVLFLCVLFYIPVLQRTTDSVVYGLEDIGTGSRPMISTFVYTYFPLVLAVVPIVALIVGCGARRTDIKHADRTFHLFFGTRPMADGALVMQKLWLALKSSLVAWAIVVALLITLLPMSGKLYTDSTGIISQESYPLYALFKPYMTPSLILWLACAFVLMVVGTWRNYAIGFWTELSGRTWLRYGYPIAMLVILFGVPSATGNVHGEAMVSMYTIFFWLIWSLVIVRFVATILLVQSQLISGLLSLRTLSRALLVYLAAYLVLIPMAQFCSIEFRKQFYDGVFHSASMANLFIVGVTILWIPIVRILLATQMLNQKPPPVELAAFDLPKVVTAL